MTIIFDNDKSSYLLRIPVDNRDFFKVFLKNDNNKIFDDKMKNLIQKYFADGTSVQEKFNTLQEIRTG